MLCFFISIISFLILVKSLPLKPLPLWATEVRLLSVAFWREFSHFSLLKNFRRSSHCNLRNSSTMSSKKRCVARVEDSSEMSILDLPELTLECILGKLPPAGLCSMAGVCSEFRERCKSDYMWERHMKEKWGRVIGATARKEWNWYLDSRRDLSCGSLGITRHRRLIRSLACLWPLSWLNTRINSSSSKPRILLPHDSIMSWYLSLECGKFWFPAQVYNRENGHVGFMLSCYDAELCYDCHTDTFQARYPPHGRRTIVIEEGVQWERLRAPPVDTSAHDLHVSDCLNDLRPGDNIEIQWRRNKEFPYGWWYGIVGHLEPCDGNEHFCRCSSSDTVVLEFNQYAPGSRWRQTSVNRKDHQEEGNETDGFYGGIRKLQSKDEILTWKRLWPSDSLV